MILLLTGTFIPTVLWLILLPETQMTPVIVFDVKEDGSTINKTVATSLLRYSTYVLNLLAESYPDDPFPIDCEDVLRSGKTESGVYKVRPMSRISKEPVEVYCDMEDDGGGWTVIQRRGNNRMKNFFQKNWYYYKKGFGNLQDDFWLGNDNIYSLTNQKAYSLKITIKDRLDSQRYALYDTFWIDNEDRKYTLHINGYTGNAGDSMGSVHNEAPFTTVETTSYNKGNFSGKHAHQCLQKFTGGWWIKACYNSNLNGLYATDASLSIYTGITWDAWKSRIKPFKETEMKIRKRGKERESTFF